MTDIRLMSKDEVTKLNKGKTMDKLTKTKTNGGTRKPKNTTPAWTSISEVDPEELNEALASTASRNEFTRKLSALEVSNGLKIEGDFDRLRTSASLFGKKAQKKFKVLRSKDNGFVLVARLE